MSQKFHSVPLLDPAPVRVRHYYKYELATLYGISQETLVAEINRFLPEFEQMGYQKNKKLLNPLQVQLLFQKIGPP
jgi:hypothetical protein